MNSTHDLNMGYGNYMWPTNLSALNDELTLGIEALIDRGEMAPPNFFLKKYILLYIYALNLAILFFKITFCPFNNIFDFFFFCSNVIVTNLPTTFL